MDHQIDQTLAEASKRAVLEKAILHVYNDRMLQVGLITADQHRRMRHQIAVRKPLKGPEMS